MAAQPKFILQADKPIAVDSADHLAPHGTAKDNSRNGLFNRKLQALLPQRNLWVLDLGCSGGGFVKSWLDAGHVGVGLEGSDFSRRTARAEWPVIPENLFTCDATAHFQLGVVDPQTNAQQDAAFDVITAWEFMEHIAQADLPMLLQNVLRHLKPGGLCIFSIADCQDTVNGVSYHRTVQNRDWWLNKLSSLGFANHADLVSYFEPDWVRGPLQGAPNSFHVVLTRAADAPPAIPTNQPCSAADYAQAGMEVVRQIEEGNPHGYCINSEYALRCFDSSLAKETNYDALYGRAFILACTGRRIEAREVIERLLRQQPDHAKARQLLGGLSALPAAGWHGGGRTPKFSVITPSFNCAPFIAQMIESVQAQNYGDIEHIVIDGCSQDGTVDVLKRYPHLRWISEPDRGEGDALNKALRLAGGDIIHFLNADDWIEPGVYRRVAEEMNPAQGRHIVFGKTNMVDGTGRFLWLKCSEPQMTLPLLLRWWCNDRHPHQPSCFFSRQLVDDLGPFNSELHYSLDYQYWLRAVLKYPFHFIDMVMSTMRNRENSKSTAGVLGQIESFWRVTLPYHRYLPPEERVAFWQEYYGVLLRDQPAYRGQPVIAPVTREAVIGLALLLNNHPDKQKTEDFAGAIVERSTGSKLAQELAQIARESVLGQTAPDAPAPSVVPPRVAPRIVIDGVFYQIHTSGIARVWTELMRQWAAGGFARHLILLDRAGTAPNIPGIQRCQLPAMNWLDLDGDRRMLQNVCDQLGADLLASTYYTTPITTPSLFTVYDMIPEVLGYDLNEPWWKAKHHAIRHAAAFVSISASSARDLLRFFPEIAPQKVTVAPIAASGLFRPRSSQEIASFRQRCGAHCPYFLIVGVRRNNKNAVLSFRALQRLPNVERYNLICTGRDPLAPDEIQMLPPTLGRVSLRLADDELAVAYSGAVALLFPSRYEGFGLPVLEAMACGCPAITCANSSLTEVGGDAVIYVPPDNVEAMVAAMLEVQKPEVRQGLVQRGLARARTFSWETAAANIKEVLLKTAQDARAPSGS